ncbi:hypothetical protein [Streptomyces clavuligerus]|uniref:hypothetical protein n=1 Tax=Streptomyces clavuligerus TaxID=1901 RepID=UPI0001851F03|nr:hypothetical protein [Streptomyces clavuligerus]ANW22651.1 hypothetical protein BB341_30580 [Streptomyces clavuligerus]MBY6301043.1 hypothetical protein [Streptomyces clavuligerus]QPJ96954.1 hypothetical protein GE265_27930 [Streptomyces clavuligerus]QPL66851.1 hypothetical protein I3J04_28110 [Streptomyces clavuligerus]QPL72881.1 hypothetical protein I3J05_28160 [Streptomyces clavuligerus]
MAYEVVTARFRTELHARWSVFFDVLDVPWVYEPRSFPAADGSVCTPAFWLPSERIWFAAEEENAPSWWSRFTAAVIGSDDLWEPWNDDGDDPVEGPQIEVGGEWHGEVVLCLGGIPDGYTPCRDLTGGPWHRHDLGMYANGDTPYRWTVCPWCGLFGVTFWGYAERLPCLCLDDGKVDNSADERLMDAYQAAAEERFAPEDDSRPDYPVARRFLVRQEGTELAEERCTRRCRSVGDQMRAELPPGAYPEVPDGADTLCGECPGFVCTECGQQPAARAGAECGSCEPPVRLTYWRARQILNERAAEAGHASRRSAREINTLINRETGVRSRNRATLADLAAGLTLVERWIADPSLVPLGGTARRPRLSDEELDRMHGAELRRELSGWVGPVAAAGGEPFALVQVRLNYVMGAATRADADDEQLREGIRQAQDWVHHPGTYQEHVRGAEAEVEPDGLPEPMRTRTAPADSSCHLCTTPVAAGELVGRIHQPRGRGFATLGWLCAHCLYDRRSKPRRLDLLLRLFHQLFAGGGVRVNAAEAEVLLTWLLAAPAAELPQAELEALPEVFVVLQRAVEAREPVTPLSYYGARAAIGTLHHAKVAAGGAEREAVVLDAVVQHLAEWQANPQGLEPEYYRGRRAWRSAILEETEQPTVLSQRGGPFFV